MQCFDSLLCSFLVVLCIGSTCKDSVPARSGLPSEILRHVQCGRSFFNPTMQIKRVCGINHESLCCACELMVQSVLLMWEMLTDFPIRSLCAYTHKLHVSRIHTLNRIRDLVHIKNNTRSTSLKRLRVTSVLVRANGKIKEWLLHFDASIPSVSPPCSYTRTHLLTGGNVKVIHLPRQYRLNTQRLIIHNTALALAIWGYQDTTTDGEDDDDDSLLYSSYFPSSLWDFEDACEFSGDYISDTFVVSSLHTVAYLLHLRNAIALIYRVMVAFPGASMPFNSICHITYCTLYT